MATEQGDGHRVFPGTRVGDVSPALSSRNEFLDLVKGYLIFLVVYGHAIQFGGYEVGVVGGNAAYYADPVYRGIYSFHMALFIGVSGYFAWGAVHKRSFFEFNRNRFCQIVVPMLAWSVLYHGARLCRELVKTRDLASVKSFPVLELGLEFWFLWAVFIGGLLVSAGRTTGRAGIVFYIAAFCGLVFISGNEVMTMTAFTFPFFVLGYLVYGNKWKLRKPRLVFGISIVVSAIAWWIWEPATYVYESGMKPDGNLVNLLIRYSAGISGSMVFLGVIWQISKKYQPRLVKQWGKESLAIYIIQTYIFIPMIGLDHPLRHWKYFNVTVAPLLAFLICCLCVVVAAALRRSGWLAFLFLGVPRKKRA